MSWTSLGTTEGVGKQDPGWGSRRARADTGAGGEERLRTRPQGWHSHHEG